MQNLIRIISIPLLLCCGNHKTLTPDSTSKFDLSSHIEQRVNTLVFNYDTGGLRIILDSLEPLLPEGTPALVSFWLISKSQQMLIAKNPDSARFYVDQALAKNLKNDNKKGLIGVYSTLTNLMMIKNRRDSALYFALKGYYQAKSHDSVPLGLNYKLFQLYKTGSDWENARKYAFEGYPISLNNPYWKTFFSAALSMYYEQTKQFDSAVFYWRNILADTAFYSKEFEATKLFSFGALLTSNSQPQDGLAFMLKAMPLLREIKATTAGTYLNLALAYTKLELLDNSLLCLDTAYNDAIRQGEPDPTKEDQPDILKQIMELKAANYAALKNYQKAYINVDSSYKMLQVEMDSSIAKKGRELEAKYQMKEKEDEIESLALANESSTQINEQRLIIILIMGLVLFLSAVIVFLTWRKRQMQNQIRETELRQQLLRSQMEPHFIFNSLGILSSLIASGQNEKSIKYLEEFDQLLRFVIKNTKNSFVPLSDEISALKAYLALQAMNFPNKFKYNMDICQDIQTENILVPPMLLQPFVENAIMHGISKLDYQGLISVDFKLVHGLLKCTIEDNGVGIDVRQLRSRRSSSTMVTQDRLSILSRQTRKKGKLLIVDKQGINEGNGVKVMLDIPYMVDY